MKKIIIFFKEAFHELKEKTVWPSKDEVKNTTIVVIVSIIVIALFLYAVDMLSLRLFDFLIIDNINFLKKYITPGVFPVFIFGSVVLVWLYNFIKNKIRRR